MLFQSTLRKVKLGQSNCNQDCYDVLVYGVPQIIASNDFWSGYNPEDKKHREARGWIDANMIYVTWNEKCFYQDQDLQEEAVDA